MTGLTGQDGYYLSRLLLEAGHEVYAGVPASETRAAQAIQAELGDLRLVNLDLVDARSIDEAVSAVKPDRVFHLAAQSHVPTSWESPALTTEINSLGTLHLLTALSEHAPDARLVYAGTGDYLDHAQAPPTGLTPETPSLCTNPYAISKLAGAQFVQAFRATQGCRGSVAIMLNHTSPRRPPAFIEKKIVRASVAISEGREEKLVLGSLDTARDWSWAEDIVAALAKMAELDAPQDLVLGSGALRTLGDWVRICFERLGLHHETHLELDPSLLHRGDRTMTFADISCAESKLDWKPQKSFDEIVHAMIDAELRTRRDK